MKRTISKSILVVFILLQFIFTNCSTLPGEADARKDLENKIKEESKGRIELLEFKKTNGLSQNMFGHEIYTLEFNALIEFKEGGSKDEGLYGIYFNDFRLYAHDFSNKFFPKGSQVKLEGKIDYEKTENGWRASKSMDIKAIKE